MKNRKNRKWMQLTRRCLMYLLVMITVISAVMPGAVYAAESIFDPGCVLCKVGNCSEHCTGDASTCKLLDCPIHQGGGTGTYSGDQSNGMVTAKNSRAGGYPISQDTYDSQRRVYWDITVNKGTYQKYDFHPFEGKRSDVIESVTLNNTVVKIGNSGATPGGTVDSPYNWDILKSELTSKPNFDGYGAEYYGTGAQLTTYYPGAYGISPGYFESAGGVHFPAVEETKTLRIKPKPGWKVVTVIVACTSTLNSSHTNTVPAQPYDCCTFDYGRGEAFFEQFTAKDGALTLNLPSKAFGHLSNMNPNSYFILIEAVQDPNYVSYGSVKVVKNVNSTSAADLAATYTFKAEYFDANGSKTNFPANAVLSGANSGNESLANKSDHTFTLKRNGTATISGLPVGSKVLITETKYDDKNIGDSGMTVSYSTTDHKVTSAQNAPTLTVTNSRADGSVKVKKIVNSTSAADMAATYTFKAEYFDVNGSKTNFPANARLSGANSGNGSLVNKPDYTFTLKHNGTATISGLPVGSKVLITETKYDNKNIGDSGMTVLYSTTDHKVTSKTGAETLEVTNKRDTATLSVTKNVNSSSPADKTDDYSFEAKYIDVDGIVKDFPDGVKVTIGSAVQSVKKDEPFKFTLKHGQTAEFSGLPAGSKIKVTETVPDGMTATDTGTKDIATGGSWTVTNSRANGSVKVQKVVESSISADLSADYSFEAKYIDVDSDTNENFPSGVTMKIGTGTPVNVPSNNNVFEFELKHNEIAEFSGLPIGSKLQITETEPRGMEVTYNPLDKKVESAAADPATLIVTNKPITGEATVTKVVDSTSSVDLLRKYCFTARFMDENGNTGVNFPGGVTVKIGSAEAVPVPDTKNDYSFTLTNGQSAVFSGLPKDSAIVVTENDVPENITVTVDGNAVGPNGVTIPWDSSKDFTNTRPVADVVVKKTVTGGIVDAGKEFTFTATLKDKNAQGEWITIDFPDGNSSINFTLKHNQPYTFENLPVGAQLTIVETTDDNYDTTNNKADGNNGLKAVYVVKENGSNEEIVFTNALKNNTIVVEKKVEQDFDSKTEFQFTAELYFKYTGATDTVKVNFPTSVEADKAGNSITFNADRSQASFTLKGGEKAIFKGLPVGSILKVQEAEADFFTTVNTHKDGTDAKASLQVALTEGTITYTNTRKLGEVKISKTVVGSAADPDKVFEFEATLLDPRIDPAVAISFPDAVKTIDGVKLDLTGKKASFSLKDGQSITLTGLYEGTVLKIIEKEADFFDVTVDPASGEQTVDTETPKEIKFTNTRQLAPVTVSKEITGQVIDPTIAFTFTAQLFDTKDAKDPIAFPQSVIDVADFTMSADNKTATFTLRHGESITFPDLYVGSKLVINETRDDRFDPSNTAGTGVHAEYIVKADGENETIAYTNKLLNGSLKILKTVAGPIIDKEQEFEFTATLWKPLWDDNREPVLDPETKEQQLEQIPFHKKVSGSSFIGTLFDESVKITLSDDNMTATFVLKHEDVAILQNLYIGSVVKVSETEHRNYETTNSVTPDSLDAQMMIEGVKRQQIEYKNAIKLTSLTIDKTVTGNLGEREREFSFTVNMKDKYDNVLAFKVPAGVDYDVATNTATFTLTHHSDPITLTEIPVGAIVTIQEGIRDYKMSAKLNGMEKFEGEKQDDPELKVKDDTVTFHVVDAVEDNIEIINHKDVKVDTGISLDSLPWIVVLGGVAAAAALMVLRRRRYDED